MNKASEIYNIRRKEKRDSRIKEVKNYISNTSLSSLMNNVKWFKVLEEVEFRDVTFKMKLLLNSETIEVNQIFELEESSILINNNGEFIEFMEIESIEVPRSIEFKSFCNRMKLLYSEK
ncbi:MAG: hypothetical protein HRU03_09390, partial [Nanoarchaeales archaeon]|nr:hypothetical protein [Nanoarchaeales archaeon]